MILAGFEEDGVRATQLKRREGKHAADRLSTGRMVRFYIGRNNTKGRSHMEKHSKKLAVLVSACLLTVAGGATAWAAEATGGKATYDKLCVSCHGADGKGNPAMAKALGEKGLNIVGKDTQGKKDADLLKVIVEGAGKMPASGKSLSKPEQADVLSYTRSLAK
jgi:mono/diheme cytochrome c family protein